MIAPRIAMRPDPPEPPHCDVGGIVPLPRPAAIMSAMQSIVAAEIRGPSRPSVFAIVNS